MTEEETYDTEPEITTQLTVPSDATQKTLIAFEGTMLPSKTELAFAHKGKFDLYTVTNFSFADLA